MHIGLPQLLVLEPTNGLGSESASLAQIEAESMMAASVCIWTAKGPATHLGHLFICSFLKIYSTPVLYKAHYRLGNLVVKVIAL